MKFQWVKISSYFLIRGLVGLEPFLSTTLGLGTIFSEGDTDAKLENRPCKTKLDQLAS